MKHLLQIKGTARGSLFFILCWFPNSTWPCQSCGVFELSDVTLRGSPGIASCSISQVWDDALGCTVGRDVPMDASLRGEEFAIQEEVQSILSLV